MDNLEFKTLTSAEFNDYMRNHKEKNYQLIDVRQPAEYEQGHIPGAKLMPLSEVETKLFSLPNDRDLIFYCHNGGRSQWAASLVGESEISAKTVYHLWGGMLAWEGRPLTGYPRVKIFEENGSIEEMLAAAMNLEKGAWRFYRRAMEVIDEEAVLRILDQVSSAEKAHAMLIYGFWKKFQYSPAPFDRVYNNLDGKILEGGHDLEDVCRRLKDVRRQGCMAVIEFAMAIEYSAYDLYRTMADRSGSDEARQTFLSIAQAEKAHMRSLTRALDQCPENPY